MIPSEVMAWCDLCDLEHAFRVVNENEHDGELEAACGEAVTVRWAA